MRKLHLIAIIGIVLVGTIMIPSAWTISVHEYLNEKECFETKEFLDRQEAEQELERWEIALGDKMAGMNFNGLDDKSLTPTPLTICVFVNQ